MTKFVVSYLFKETYPDLHATFKRAAKAQNFCEYIYATDVLNRSKYCKLPNTTLWSEGKTADHIRNTLIDLADSVLTQAADTKRITLPVVQSITIEGGLIENILVAPLIPDNENSIIMQVKEGKFKGKVVSSVSLSDCLTYQRTDS